MPLNPIKPGPTCSASGALTIVMDECIVVFSAGSRRINVDVRPLLFGSAWKILDQLVELSLAGDTAELKADLRISEKKKFISSGTCIPLSEHRELWDRLARTYIATVELRHELIHRRVRFEPTSGHLEGTRTDGSQFGLDVEHQESFVRAVLRAADVAINGRLSNRERADILAHLDKLAHVHGLPLSGHQPIPESVPRVLVDLHERDRVDVPNLLALARRAWQATDYFDLEIRLPNDVTFRGELESAPCVEFDFNPESPPAWLQTSEMQRGP